MRIGIMGGSYNPIHMGHLVLIEHVREAANLDMVVLMPAFVSPFKQDKDSASCEDRLEMARLALKSNPAIAVDSYEVEKASTSYTIDTMNELRRDRWPDDDLFFIAGSDSVLEIEKWKNSEELLTKYGIVAGARPGYGFEQLEAHAEHLRAVYGTEAIVVKVPQLDISSTDIRNRVKNNQSIRYLVPDEVMAYIADKGLYR